jgi:hypothetical protein
MTLEELALKLAVLVVGEDSPELRADLAAYVAAQPPPLEPLAMTDEQFDVIVADCGGAEAVRRSAFAYYGIPGDSPCD